MPAQMPRACRDVALFRTNRQHIGQDYPTLIYSRVSYTRKGLAHKRKGVGNAQAGLGMHRQH